MLNLSSKVTPSGELSLESPLPNPRAGSSSTRLVLRVVSIAAILLIVSVAIFNIISDRNHLVPLLQIEVTNTSMTQMPNGEFAFTVIVKNIGVTTTALNGYVGGAYATWLTFFPNPIGPGQSATGTAMTSSHVASFAGSSGDVLVPNSSSLTSASMTIEMSFKYNAYAPDQQMIVSKGSAGGNSFYFYTFRSVNNVNDFVVYDNGTRYDQQLGNIFAPGAWYTVDFTIDGQYIAAYVDGAIVQSWPRPFTFGGNNDDIILGRCSCGGYNFNGSIAFLRLFDKALSAQEIRQNFLLANPATQNLTLSFALNNTVNNTICDPSGDGNNGGVEGPVTLVPQFAPCDLYSANIVAKAESGQTYTLSQVVQPKC